MHLRVAGRSAFHQPLLLSAHLRQPPEGSACFLLLAAPIPTEGSVSGEMFTLRPSGVNFYRYLH